MRLLTTGRLVVIESGQRSPAVHRFLLLAGLAALCASAAIASEHNRRIADPNKKTCRTVAEIGSRLKRSRACHTAAEWAELRRQSTLNIEKIQAQGRAWNSEP